MTPFPKKKVTAGQLDALLSETVSNAVSRECNQFDELAGPFKQSLVLFGARKLGRKTLHGLRQAGVEPLAFADNNEELWGTSIDGVPVFSPEEASRRFGSSAVFVITIWGRGRIDSMSARAQQLMNLGCRRVIPFVPLYWKYSNVFLPHNALNLPHLVLEQADDVARCFDLFIDELSRAEFMRQLTWRITGDFDALGDPVDDEIYFPRVIAQSPAPEVFVDCGAFDGDTLVRFIDRKRGKFEKIFAFEPDPANLRALQQTVSRLTPEWQDRIEVLPFAVGETECSVLFSATGTLGAAVGSGELEVPCVRLDDVLKDAAPTFIKMDIEAAEPGALLGGGEVIRKHSPVIAACSYHVQDHLWTIPLTIAKIQPGYTLLLRQHIQLVEDLVCYAAPQHLLYA
jgi:FkbM family methyltransferase